MFFGHQAGHVAARSGLVADKGHQEELAHALLGAHVLQDGFNLGQGIGLLSLESTGRQEQGQA